MFQKTIDGTSLRSNLIHDHFFGEHNNKLTIIDDYNIVDIKDDAVDFYIESFEGVGVTNIKIYFQVKAISEERRQEINNLAHKYGLDSNKLLCYCVFVKKGLYPKRFPIEELVFSQKPSEKVDKALNFINSMKEIGITVTLQPYSSLNFKPPFHGRYWLTDEKGYIVDGSMQTYGSGLIFAQLMDAENFNRIRQLFNTHISNNANAFERLTYEDLHDIRYRFNPYHYLEW